MPAPEQIEWDDSKAVHVAPQAHQIEWDDGKAQSLAHEGPGLAEAALKGVQDVPTFGFGDELGAAMQAGLLKLSGDPSTFADNYRHARDENRRESHEAAKAHPLAYYGAGLAAAAPLATVLPSVSLGEGAAAKIGSGVLNGAAQGALSGFGNSEAKNGTGALADTLTGAGIGGLAGGALGAAGVGVDKLRGFAQGKVAEGVKAAQELAANKQADLENAARGALGAETQKGNRLVENLMRLMPDATPEQRAALEQLEASGALNHLKSKLMDSTLESLPTQVKAIEGKAAALQELRAGRDQAIAAQAEKLTSPATALEQIGDRAQRYLPRAAGAVVGKVLGTSETPSLATGQVLGPMMHSLKRMANHPSVKVPFFKTLAAMAGNDPAALASTVGPGPASVLAKAFAEGGEDGVAAHHFLLAQMGLPNYPSDGNVTGKKTE